MKIDKHEEVLKEVLDEIGSSLRDRDGILAHQRRLAFILSMGSINLLELYFHKEGIMKEGSKINHQWFKKKTETVFEKLQNQVAKSHGFTMVNHKMELYGYCKRCKCKK